MIEQKHKPQVGFFDFSGCEGCQLTVVDLLQTRLELLEAINIVEFREALTGTADHLDLAFVEGSCTRAEDEARLKSIRDRSTRVVALGACAHIAGVNALRSSTSTDAAKKAVYADQAHLISSYDPRPIGAVIAVDAVVPGCPIDPEDFHEILVKLLQGRTPELSDSPVCMECKSREIECVYPLRRPCLGPITRSGCGAICPGNGFYCVGCRGTVSNPNLEALSQVILDHGMSSDDLERSLSMFLNWQLGVSKPCEAGDD